jgi:signal transduction histidine kinase
MSSLLSPWRGARALKALAFVELGLLTGLIGFVLVVALVAAAAGTLPVFPVSVVLAWVASMVAAGLGRAERSRVAALLGTQIPPPHAPLSGSWWTRWKARVRSASRWREVGYWASREPLGALSWTVVTALWGGSLALIALPAYVSSLPAGKAHFNLFTVTSGPGSALCCVAGVIGLVVLAPWVTVGVAGLNEALARRLLGPSGRGDLHERVTRLEASRVAAVDSAEAERRRIERDLHDGAQQRLVSVAMDLGLAQERFDTDPEAARELLRGAHGDAKEALVELRQLVRGFHPAILEDRGLDAALSAIVARAPVPVSLSVEIAERPPAAVESAAYFVVTEALTNVAKHAHATAASVAIARRNNRLVVEITDNGAGGADESKGSGLRGLADRVHAHGGWMTVLSPPGGPTTIVAELPCES